MAVATTVACRGMSHRFSTWWRALGVVLLSLATVTWPSAARATTSTVTLLAQSAVTSLTSSGVGQFTATVAAPRSARVSVSIYPALVTRSELESVISGGGDPVAPWSTSAPLALGCARRGVASFALTLYERAAGPARLTCGHVAPRLKLRCLAARCDGVFPLRYLVTTGAATTTAWSLVAIQSSPVRTPVRVALVETLTPRSLKHPRRSAAALRAIAHFPHSPVTLGANYETLARVLVNPTFDRPWVRALVGALTGTAHHAVSAPPSAVDFAGLAQNGLTTQVAQQVNLGTDLLARVSGHASQSPVVLGGPQSPRALAALAASGVSDAVVPESDLSVAPSNTLLWGAPFHVPGAGALTVLSTDGPLSTLVSDQAISPGLRATLAVATLAFLHFEEPNAPTSRSVVVDVALSATPPSFLYDFLGALAHDPFSQLTSLPALFDPSLIATDGAPRERAVSSAAHSAWSRRNVATLLTLIGQANSFAQGVQSTPERSALRVAVAQSEVRGSATTRQSALDAATAALAAQLRAFSINSSAITLAGQGSSLPITVLSSAPYRVDAVVHLTTPGLSFPKGSTVPVTLSSPTQSLRVAVSSPQGSSFTLQVTLTTPNGDLVLARSALQVRVAGTSVVGYLITLVSLAVLAVWWWRTNRRRPRGRHAR